MSGTVSPRGRFLLKQNFVKTVTSASEHVTLVCAFTEPLQKEEDEKEEDNDSLLASCRH